MKVATNTNECIDCKFVIMKRMLYREDSYHCCLMADALSIHSVLPYDGDDSIPKPDWCPLPVTVEVEE